MSNKLGFWSVISIVFGSQIGSAVFMLPTTLAPFGLFSIIGLVIAAMGALSLSVVFSLLCWHFPQTGGPHVYVKHMFGDTAGFFVGWTYWVISWVSSTAVVIVAVANLIPIFGEQSSSILVAAEITVLLVITMLNLLGVGNAGKVEFILSIVKFIPLLVLPLMALYFFDANNLAVSTESASFNNIGKIILLTLWGFIGLETATTPADNVINPARTIPLAIILGTLAVAFIYLINSLGILGLMGVEEITQSKSPYASAAKIIFGGKWHLAISLLTSLVCIGTLNAWVLSSGQIALGCANDGLFPKKLGITNKFGAPFIALLFSLFGSIPFFILMRQSSYAEQLTNIVDVSVVSFLYIYAACCLALIKLLHSKKQTIKYYYQFLLIAVVSLLFCIWVIYTTDGYTLLLSMLFVISGLPVYLLMNSKRNR